MYFKLSGQLPAFINNPSKAQQLGPITDQRARMLQRGCSRVGLQRPGQGSEAGAGPGQTLKLQEEIQRDI